MSLREGSHDFPSQDAVPGFWWGDNPGEPGHVRSVFPVSSWDERALSHIEQHLADEAAAGVAYETFAEHGDPSIRYLAGLLAADEQRHHQILENIARALRAEIAGGAVATGVPEPSPLTAAQRKDLLEETRRLLEIESADAAALKELKRDLRPARDETLWPLLAEIMALDTDKHIRILKGIDRLLRRRRPR